MTISRDMTTAEASVLNYIKNKATHELPIEASSIRDVFNYDKRTLENIIESLRVNFGHPIVAKKTKTKRILHTENTRRTRRRIGPLQAPNFDRTKEPSSDHGC